MHILRPCRGNVVLQTKLQWERGSKIGNSRKWLREGAKRFFFGPRERKAPCTGAKWGCTSAKQVSEGARLSKTLLGDLCSLGPKDLLHPLVTTFGNFEFFRVGFWQNGFFADFYFWAAGIFSRILSPDFSHRFWKSAQKNPPGKSPAKSSNKSPTRFCRGGGGGGKIFDPLS